MSSRAHSPPFDEVIAPRLYYEPPHRTGREDFPHPALQKNLPILFQIGFESSFVIILNPHQSTEDASLSQRFNCQSLPSTGITLLQQYYELIRLPECCLQYLTVYRLDIAYSFWESILGLPSSHILHLIPCCGLRPRWTHITSLCRRALCYFPRLEMLNIGAVIAAFSY